MRNLIAALLTFLFVLQPVAAQRRDADFDGAKMLERVKRLSADDFEGRGPGTEGGRLAARYIAEQMRSAGVRPGNRNSYFQNVPLVGVKADPATRMSFTGRGRNEILSFGSDFVATTGAQRPSVEIDADLVFVGYGIDAPNYRWNDYADTDVRGKVVMILVNDPPATKDEPQLFGAKALTYYGRWTYKYEEAARRGAAGVILVHSTDSAGYGWNVVRTSNGNWRYEVARTRIDQTPFLKMKSWVTEAAAEKLLKQARLDLGDLRRAAAKRGFRPVNTGLRVKVTLDSEMKRFNSPNVIGIVEGSDARLRNEYVIYTAHWDHLGVGEPD